MRAPGFLLLIAGLTISLSAAAETAAPVRDADHARRPAIRFGAPSRTGHRTLGPRHNPHRTPVDRTMGGPRG